MERNPNALYCVRFRIQCDAKLFFQPFPAGKQQLCQLLHLLGGNGIVDQQQRFHAHGLHIFILSGIGPCRNDGALVGFRQA